MDGLIQSGKIEGDLCRCVCMCVFALNTCKLICDCGLVFSFQRERERVMIRWEETQRERDILIRVNKENE